MGLTNWKGKVITRADAVVAKNYLQELELKRLELLVEQFLSFAELRSVEKVPMYMRDWVTKLDDFLTLNEKKILTNSGSVSRADMEAKVRAELQQYNRRALPTPDETPGTTVQ
ncbi:MAG: virulence RhuM family protein [SAR202 cluster bacterium]|nr:virulence RhuM family protein [SAR202 cluster bacterium]